MNRFIVCEFAAILLLSMVLVGCGPGGPDIATVKGTVTLDGSPLANATVMFVPAAGGRPATGKTDAMGEYTLNFSGGRKGAMPGNHSVQITSYSQAYTDEDGNQVPGSKEKVPTKYNVETTLEFTVEQGQSNIADFALDSKGKIAAGDSY